MKTGIRLSYAKEEFSGDIFTTGSQTAKCCRRQHGHDIPRVEFQIM